MKYIQENSLSNFQFWSGACQITDKLTANELDQIENEIEACDLFGHTPTETEINDLFWFDAETVLSLIGLSEDEVLERE